MQTALQTLSSETIMFSIERNDTMIQNKLKRAVEEYIARQNRTRHPVGHFDSAKRWYPSDSETQACCGPLRSPSRRWGNGLNKHCRTLKHVAFLMGVDQAELRPLVASASKVIEEIKNEVRGEEMKKQVKRKKSVIKRNIDCNIKRIEEISKMASEIAIEDYENGNLAEDAFEQVGRALYAMKKSSKETKKKDQRKKCKPGQQLLS